MLSSGALSTTEGKGMIKHRLGRTIRCDVDHHSRFFGGLHLSAKRFVKFFVPKLGKAIQFSVKRMYLPPTDKQTCCLFAGEYFIESETDDPRTFVVVCLDPREGKGEVITLLGELLSERDLSSFVDDKVEVNSTASVTNGELV